jgi:hypothetical protein
MIIDEDEASAAENINVARIIAPMMGPARRDFLFMGDGGKMAYAEI